MYIYVSNVYTKVRRRTSDIFKNTTSTHITGHKLGTQKLEQD